jgi:hypothetical protein
MRNQERGWLWYQLTVAFSVVFALMGFSYNVWRMEASEDNNTIRTASFEMLVNLADLEQVIYTAHYDGDFKQGSPRQGWVLVGLIDDLSVLTDDTVIQASDQLKGQWSEHWQGIGYSQNAVDHVIAAIDNERAAIKQLLSQLD